MNSSELKRVLHSRLWGKRICSSENCENTIDSKDHFYTIVENNWVPTGGKRIIKNFCEKCGKEMKLERE
jgi:hypothetical protein